MGEVGEKQKLRMLWGGGGRREAKVENVKGWGR